MKILFAALALILPPLPAFVPPAWAWGIEGHQVVAHIAARNLTAPARAAVSKLLGGEAQAMMALESSWADEIRDEAVLKSAAPPGRKAEALKFLIHFVGDIQQPLHAGENRDNGGNDIKVGYRGARTNLHHIWDDEMVSALGRDPRQVAEAIDAGLAPGQKARLGNGGPQDWAQDSARIARDAIYAKLAKADLHDLGGHYVVGNAPIARAQLAKGGLALAKILNAIFR